MVAPRGRAAEELVLVDGAHPPAVVGVEHHGGVAGGSLRGDDGGAGTVGRAFAQRGMGRPDVVDGLIGDLADQPTDPPPACGVVDDEHDGDRHGQRQDVGEGDGEMGNGCHAGAVLGDRAADHQDVGDRPDDECHRVTLHRVGEELGRSPAAGPVGRSSARPRRVPRTRPR
jgi:hypothetical protein